MLSYEIANKFLEYAKNGLTIIFVGQTPREKTFSINTVMKDVLKQKSVIQVDNVDIATNNTNIIILLNKDFI